MLVSILALTRRKGATHIVPFPLWPEEISSSLTGQYTGTLQNEDQTLLMTSSGALVSFHICVFGTWPPTSSLLRLRGGFQLLRSEVTGRLSSVSGRTSTVDGIRSDVVLSETSA